MLERKHWPNYRDVSCVEETASSLLIRIGPVNNRFLILTRLLLFAIAAGWFIWTFSAALAKVRTLSEAAYLLFPHMFVSVWFYIVLLTSMRELASVQLEVSAGMFRWCYSVGPWKRSIEVQEQHVTDVTARYKWYGNQLKVLIDRKTYSLGNLTNDDLQIITRALRRSLSGLGK